MTEKTEPYRVLARKYRPRTFDDLIGQDAMVQTLSNAFRSGRIAQAYMLTGVRGVGKTTTARILARALNYKSSEKNEPSIDLGEEGEHCQAITEGRHMDVIEMDAASHTGIEAIRDLIESAQYRPATARYKVYIIDEVHQLSGHAFNALLKTLEEPPEHVKFIFATTEIRSVPVTVLSRCQRFDLRRIEAGLLGEHLGNVCRQEKVDADPDALSMIARAADGSVRDALSMLDQAIAHSARQEDGPINSNEVRTMLGLADRGRIADLFEFLMRGDVPSSLRELSAQYATGAEPSVVLNDLAEFVHLVTRLKYVPETADDRALSSSERNRGREYADQLSVRVLGRAWQVLIKGLSEVSDSERPLPAAEMVLIRLAHASSLPAPEDLVRELTGQGANRMPAIESGKQVSESTPETSSFASTDNSVARQVKQNSGPTNSREMAFSPGSVEATPATMRQPNEHLEQLPLQRALNSFDELIFLIEDKRDLALKSAVRRHVRLVAFSNGHIDMNLVENPSRDFLTTLGSRLEEWTGKRWILSVSKEDGAPTLAEQEREENKVKLESAKLNPAVEAILEKFPGSRIVNVRIRSDEEHEPVPSADDHEDDSMGKFFD